MPAKIISIASASRWPNVGAAPAGLVAEVLERYGDHPPLWFHALLWLPLSVALALYLLGHIKGTVIALLWAHRIPAPKPSTGSFDSSA